MSHYSFNQIEIGMKAQHAYQINPEIYEAFISKFKDQNPLHTDGTYAKQLGFSDKVMHGAILNGFLSHFVGMHFPGKHTTLHSTSLEYRKPNYLNDELIVESTVEQKVDSLKVVIMKINITNKTQNYLSATGKIQVGVTQ